MGKKLVIGSVIVIALIGLLVLVLFMADGSKPGDALYSLDRSLEDFQFSLNSDKAAQAKLYIAHADERITELEAILNPSSSVALVGKVYAQDSDDDIKSIQTLLAEFHADLQKAEELINLLSDEDPNKQGLLDLVSEFADLAFDVEARLAALADNPDPEIRAELEGSLAGTIEIGDKIIGLLIVDIGGSSDPDLKPVVESKAQILLDKAASDLVRTRAKLELYRLILDAPTISEIENFISLAQDSLDTANTYYSSGDLERAYLYAKQSRNLSSIARDIMSMGELDEENVIIEAQEEIDEAKSELADAESMLAADTDLTPELRAQVEQIIAIARDKIAVAETLFSAESYVDAKITAKVAEDMAKDAQRTIERNAELPSEDGEHLLDFISDVEGKIKDLEDKLLEAGWDTTEVESLLAQAKSKIEEAKGLVDTNLFLADDTAEQAKQLVSMAKLLLEDENIDNDNVGDDRISNDEDGDGMNDDKDKNDDNDVTDDVDDNDGINEDEDVKKDDEEEDEDPEVEGAQVVTGTLVLL
ncbi:MAG: DUF5667 domain-containing protein [Candidatus Dojkabacteria bacterium]